MLQLILENIFWFIIIISAIVFVHEYGHYYVARKCGVKIETFSIGFGKEIFGFTDKNDVRWKFCMIPFGGYVKMFGDRNESSMPDLEKAQNFTREEKSRAFIYKSIYKKMMIVAAGPLANFILGIFLFTILFKVNGYHSASTIIDKIVDDSPAMHSGLKQGDKILAINGKRIKDFVDLQNIVSPAINKNVQVTVCRDQEEIYDGGIKFNKFCNLVYDEYLEKPRDFTYEDSNDLKIIEFDVKTKIREVVNIFDEKQDVAIIGISPKLITHDDELSIFGAFVKAIEETYRFSKLILVAMTDLITGERSIEELSGPIKIAKYSGKTVELGVMVVIWFVAVISINLGVINLLPIPVLDGGHLFFYIYEAIFKKPLPKKVQDFGFRFGFVLLITLMLFTTFNDLSQILGW